MNATPGMPYAPSPLTVLPALLSFYLVSREQSRINVGLGRGGRPRGLPSGVNPNFRPPADGGFPGPDVAGV
ncbi:hypothetical protein J6590_061721 [Homalodisca vitripennis]|nr:hypothetical protein J6590_061721 [Homalodisca vitripennis]